jgi:hypothetical protein
MDISYINSRINFEICKDTIYKLSDNILLPLFLKTKSVNNKIQHLKIILTNNNLNDNIISNIINDYILDIIPPSVKGKIRGHEFNKIVKEKILLFNLNNKLFDIKFNTKTPFKTINETPDVYILEKNTNKIILIMNSLDIWNGGHQKIIADKYLNDNNEHYIIINVICNEIQFKTKNKIFKLFEIGFFNNRLCYLKNLKNLINLYFSI